MTDIERLEERLSAVERTVIDGEHDFDELADLAEVVDRLERLENRLEELEGRVADLKGQTDSLQGYIANVDSVNESVEQQSASALAVVESLEQRVDDLEAHAETVDNVDQYRPTTGSSTTEQPIDEDSIADTVDELVEGTDREQRLGVSESGNDGDSPGRTGDGSTHSPGRAGDRSTDASARTGDPRASGGNSHGSTPGADPDEINRRYGGRPRPVSDCDERPGADDGRDDSDGSDGSDGSLLSSLKSKLS